MKKTFIALSLLAASNFSHAIDFSDKDANDCIRLGETASYTAKLMDKFSFLSKEKILGMVHPDLHDAVHFVYSQKTPLIIDGKVIDRPISRLSPDQFENIVLKVCLENMGKPPRVEHDD